METALATDIAKKQILLPDGLVAQSDLATGTAWDNYDELTETLSGAGTLHDTFGICYQNVDSGQATQSLNMHTAIANKVDDESVPSETVTEPNQNNVKRRKKRTLPAADKDLEPYRKKPKIGSFNYKNIQGNKPNNLTVICNRDVLWMMSTAMLENVPMWVGWNSRVTLDPSPPQNIGYMENICLPPTRLDVVVETMKRSQKTAEECGDNYAIVTYYLAVAKLALQIQSEETPTFDNVCVCLGAFHICLAYFAAIGYILEESGGPQVLVEPVCWRLDQHMGLYLEDTIIGAKGCIHFWRMQCAFFTSTAFWNPMVLYPSSSLKDLPSSIAIHRQRL